MSYQKNLGEGWLFDSCLYYSNFPTLWCLLSATLYWRSCLFFFFFFFFKTTINRCFCQQLFYTRYAYIYIGIAMVLVCVQSEYCMMLLPTEWGTMRFTRPVRLRIMCPSHTNGGKKKKRILESKCARKTPPASLLSKEKTYNLWNSEKSNNTALSVTNWLHSSFCKVHEYNNEQWRREKKKNAQTLRKTLLVIAVKNVSQPQH